MRRPTWLSFGPMAWQRTTFFVIMENIRFMLRIDVKMFYVFITGKTETEIVSVTKQLLWCQLLGPLIKFCKGWSPHQSLYLQPLLPMLFYLRRFSHLAAHSIVVPSEFPRNELVSYVSLHSDAANHRPSNIEHAYFVLWKIRVCSNVFYFSVRVWSHLAVDAGWVT